MKLKKMTAVLGATALVVSCLGGCGSGKDESASASKTTAKSADDVDLSEKVDISIGGLSLFDSSTTTWPTEVRVITASSPFWRSHLRSPMVFFVPGRMMRSDPVSSSGRLT